MDIERKRGLGIFFGSDTPPFGGRLGMRHPRKGTARAGRPRMRPRRARSPTPIEWFRLRNKRPLSMHPETSNIEHRTSNIEHRIGAPLSPALSPLLRHGAREKRACGWFRGSICESCVRGFLSSLIPRGAREKKARGDARPTRAPPKSGLLSSLLMVVWPIRPVFNPPSFFTPAHQPV
ncbi:MAG: hypothetical protein JWQ04_3375 [Pedosphaera sp.]|nr:hypothetical protein [Pedosphaera sp.]